MTSPTPPSVACCTGTRTAPALASPPSPASPPAPASPPPPPSPTSGPGRPLPIEAAAAPLARAENQPLTTERLRDQLGRLFRAGIAEGAVRFDDIVIGDSAHVLPGAGRLSLGDTDIGSGAEGMAALAR